MTLLKAVPLTAVLFVLFPRISGPLWGTPGDAAAGNTGLSNSMSPGSISRLFESTEIAFRVKFAARRRATTSFTGAVRYSARSAVARGAVATTVYRSATPSIQGDARSALSYTVTLEPHNRDWLFALDAPAALPVTNEFVRA